MSSDRHVSPSQAGPWSPEVPFSPRRVPIFYGWVIMAAATVGVVFSIPGQTMGFSVFTDILMEELGLSRVQLSTAYCVGTMASGFSLPALGRLFDRIGARRMIVYASLATSLVLVYLSRVRWVFDGVTGAFAGLPGVAVGFVIMVIGFYLIRLSAQGVLTMTSRNIIGKWFDYHRGTALALSGVVTAFMFSIAPRLLDTLIAVFTWSGAWLFLAVLTGTVMAGVGWLFYRDNPEECGMVMDGTTDSSTRRKPHADSVTHRDYTRGEALRTWGFWSFNLSFAFFSMFSTAFTFHIVSIGAEAARGRSEIIGYFVPMAIISVVVNMFSGWVSSRTRLKYLLMMMNGGALAGVLGTIYLDTGWGAWAFIGGNGICGGAFSALTGIAWPRFFGRRWLGAISGLGMSTMVLASGVGPLIFSLSLAVTGAYAAILWTSAVIPALLMLGSLWADNPQRHDESVKSS